MKNLKTTFLIAIVVLFTACKKENSLKQAEPKDYKTANMKMNYYGKVLEYTVKYSPTTKQLQVSGRDAKEFNEITAKYKNAVAMYTGEHDITFFNTKDEYYAYVFRNMMNKPAQKNGTKQNTGSNERIFNVQTVNTNLYENVNYSNLLRTSTFDNFNYNNVITQNFTVYQKCGNDGTDNWCPTNYTVSTVGVKETWVSDRDNDKYSSFNTTDATSIFDDNGSTLFPGITYQQYYFMQIVFFQDVNFGGKAIGFNKPINPTVRLDVYDLRTKIIYAYGATWNDRISSFYQFFTI